MPLAAAACGACAHGGAGRGAGAERARRGFMNAAALPGIAASPGVSLPLPPALPWPRFRP